MQFNVPTSGNSRLLRGQDLKRVTVDTTVQPKAITFPTDAKLLPCGNPGTEPPWRAGTASGTGMIIKAYASSSSTPSRMSAAT